MNEGSAATVVRAVYAHAPFCARRCSYCDFAVQVRSTGDARAWSETLSRELELVRKEGLFELADELASLYVGGGTPSLLGPHAMQSLARLVGPERLRGSALEWTAEANPESLDTNTAVAWKRAGVNRLSLGVQTFHDPTLRWMGRLHGADGARSAVQGAKAAGFENLSVDLIFGLPAHVGRSWSGDLDQAIDLDVAHVSLYGLGIEAGTPLGRAVAEGREAPVDDVRYAEEYLEAAERLVQAGYEHYEVSNFARPGRRARHNATYWTGDPYLGLGNGAHSYAHPVRRWNVRDWEEYRARALEAAPSNLAVPPRTEASRETLDAEAVEIERIWLGLRTCEGVPEPGPGTERHEVVDQWVGQKWASRGGGRVALTPAGWLHLDRLAVELVG